MQNLYFFSNSDAVQKFYLTLSTENHTLQQKDEVASQLIEKNHPLTGAIFQQIAKNFSKVLFKLSNVSNPVMIFCK